MKTKFIVTTMATVLFTMTACKKEQCSTSSTQTPNDQETADQQCQTQESSTNDSSKDNSTSTPPTNDSSSPDDQTSTQPRDPASDGSSFDIYQEIAIPTGQAVDNQYPQSRELMVVRGSNQNFAVDKCDPEVQGKDRFADRITYAVNKRFENLKIDVGSSVAPLFGLSKDRNTYLANSLVSHPFCRVTETTLQNTFQGKRIPSAATIKKAQKFYRHSQSLSQSSAFR
jgi:hypothetical protein